MNYIEEVIKNTKEKNAHEPEFIQSVSEVLRSLPVVINENEKLYREHAILERMVEPDRQIMFRVPWMDDKGIWHVNRGYRVQFNNAIGPYKGGLRFQKNVNLSIIKFLGFEQTFKNSLTSLPMGGGKGGSDFDSSGKSDAEIMRFCYNFMTELQRHIGANLDVPAGDMGVGGREIGYLFGAYKKINGSFENGVLTGKALSFGGSKIRPEATGYGATYFLQEILKKLGEGIKGKKFAISGFGNVAWGATKKITELGGKVVSLSGPDGYIYDKNGVSTPEKINYMVELRMSGKNCIQAYADKFGVEFVPKQKPWGNVDADIYMPCATQNEILLDDAKKILDKKVKYLIEVSNMPTTNEASELLQKNGILVAPSKAVNAGGVAVSGLEMTQNSERLSWESKDVDEKLQHIMVSMHKHIVKTLEDYSLPYNLVTGANIAGFIKVADAMIAQGVN